MAMYGNRPKAHPTRLKARREAMIRGRCVLHCLVQRRDGEEWEVEGARDGDSFPGSWGFSS